MGKQQSRNVETVTPYVQNTFEQGRKERSGSSFFRTKKNSLDIDELVN